jgi:serine/threonine protein phosphatase 1
LVPLLGNHEIMLLTALDDQTEIDFWLANGGQETLDAYGGDLALMPPAHLQFLSSLQHLHVLEDDFYVHANYAASLPFDRQPDFTMFWEHLSMHIPGPHVSGKRAIVGHSPRRKGRPLVLKHLVCIDTYCYGGGWLTALDVRHGHYWQADSSGELRSIEPSPLE